MTERVKLVSEQCCILMNICFSNSKSDILVCKGYDGKKRGVVVQVVEIALSNSPQTTNDVGSKIKF